MNKLTRWLPALILMTVIFLLSSIPSKEMPNLGTWDTLVKKGGHMLGYGVLAIAFWHALKWEEKNAWTALILAMLYGLLDEFHQSFVPGRNPSLIDALGFDGGGAALLLLTAYWGKRRLLRSREKKEIPEIEDILGVIQIPTPDLQPPANLLFYQFEYPQTRLPAWR